MLRVLCQFLFLLVAIAPLASRSLSLLARV